MAGIYIHIPFCRQKCHYCNFFSVASARQMPAFVPALISEMESRRNYLEDSQIHTVYFGGGTPSLMNRNQLQQIFEALHQHFDIATDAEITLEANPDDIDSSFLSFLKQTPVNRLSIGVQSFCRRFGFLKPQPQCRSGTASHSAGTGCRLRPPDHRFNLWHTRFDRRKMVGKSAHFC